jgi:hypothetical protein
MLRSKAANPERLSVFLERHEEGALLEFRGVDILGIVYFLIMIHPKVDFFGDVKVCLISASLFDALAVPVNNIKYFL